jgi:sugar lactone lactonase YvrE
MNMNLHSISRKTSLLIAALAVCLGGLTSRAQSFTAPAVVTSSSTTLNFGLVQAQAVAADASGNIFVTRPASGELVEEPANGGPEIPLIPSGLGYPKGVAVDTFGNAFSSDYNGHLWRVPVGGGAAVDILSSCGPIDAYYLGTVDVATDGAGNVYTIGFNEADIFKITPAGACSIALSSAALQSATPNFLAADAAGNLYYAVGTQLYAYYVGAAAPVVVNASFAAINGLRTDSFGNLFVTDASTIDEVPFQNGTLAGSSMFPVLPSSSAYTIGTDPSGNLYTTDGVNIFRSALGSVPFAATEVGATSASQTVNVLFNSAETLTSIGFTSGGGASTEYVNAGTGTCSTGTAYPSGSSCTIAVTLTPAGVSVRNGAVQLLTANGVVGTAALTGLGSGAGLIVDPGLQAGLGSGWSSPEGVAVDLLGNIFISDSSAGTVSYIAAGSTTAKVISSSIAAPAGLAVGADGSVYVADPAAGSVFLIPQANGVYQPATVLVSGLSAPSALAMAGNGDLYIADAGSGKVLRVPNQGGLLNPFDQATIGSGFTAPSGVAIDSNASIFVSDSTAGTIVKIAAGTQTTIASGLQAPASLALDASGSVYVLSASSNTIERIPYSGGAYNTNLTTQLGSRFVHPVALAADASGNLYVADSGAPSVVSIQRTTGALNLGAINELASSAAQNLTLSDAGNLALTFSSPFYTASGDTSDFSVASTGSGACASSETIASGASCGVAATFTPTAMGSRSEALSFFSNAVNASSITATISGTGTNLPATTLALTLVSPTGAISFGQTVQVSSTVTAPAGSGTPEGTVQFLVNGNPYGAPVTLTAGTASIAIQNLPAGPNTVNAVYAGNSNFAGSTGTSLLLQVALATTSTTLSSTANSSAPIPPGTSVTLTALVASSISSPAPSGTVTFSAGSTVLGTVSLNTSGAAILTSSSLPQVTYSVVANYSGDSGFAASASNSIGLAILTPQFTLSSTPTALSVSQLGSVTGTFVVTPISGYTGGVDLSCSGLPVNVQCNFTPGALYFINTTNAAGATVAPGPQTVTLTINANTAPPTTVASWLFPLGGILLLGFAKKRKLLGKHGLARWSLLFVLCASSLGAVVSLAGCSNTTNFATPKGTSTVTVNLIGTPSGTAKVPADGTGSIPQSFTFTLTVQ